MSQTDDSGVSVVMLIELSHEPKAVRIIAEHLSVKEMGPADHIRTKHEIKAFVESDDLKIGTELLKRAQARRELNQSATLTNSQELGRKMAD